MPSFFALSMAIGPYAAMAQMGGFDDIEGSPGAILLPPMDELLVEEMHYNEGDDATRRDSMKRRKLAWGNPSAFAARIQRAREAVLRAKRAAQATAAPTARPSRPPTARPSRPPTARPSRPPTAVPTSSPTIDWSLVPAYGPLRVCGTTENEICGATGPANCATSAFDTYGGCGPGGYNDKKGCYNSIPTGFNHWCQMQRRNSSGSCPAPGRCAWKEQPEDCDTCKRCAGCYDMSIH